MKLKIGWKDLCSVLKFGSVSNETAGITNVILKVSSTAPSKASAKRNMSHFLSLLERMRQTVRAVFTVLDF